LPRPWYRPRDGSPSRAGGPHVKLRRTTRIFSDAARRSGVGTETDRYFVRFRSKADMRCRLALMVPVAIDPHRTKGGLKSRSAAVSWRIGSVAAQGRRRPSRFRTIQVCPKDCPSARWQADRAGIPGVYFDRRRFHHERADCTGSAGLGSRHRRNGALFGPSPPRHASVGICSGLKDQRATRLASG
jgi:hypothetical protein